MNKVYVPSQGPDDWQQFLAKPDLHWKTGYSAKSLAFSWTEAQGFPREVQTILDQSPTACLHDLEFLLGIPEHAVPLPGGRRPSQNDVFVLANGSEGLVSIAVEGKVAESFALPVDQRFSEPTHGQAIRLEFLLDLLWLDRAAVGNIGYQLLHRTASAILEARRFGARHAVMLVHSFSQELKRFEDFAAFANLYQQTAVPNRMMRAMNFDDVTLHLGCAVVNAEYLRR